MRAVTLDGEMGEISFVSLVKISDALPRFSRTHTASTDTKDTFVPRCGWCLACGAPLLGTCSQLALDEEKGEITLVENGHDVGCVTPVLKNPYSSEVLPKKRSMTRFGWSLMCGALLPRRRHQQSLDEEKGEITLVENGHDVGCVTPVLKKPHSSEVLQKKRSMTRCGWSLVCAIDTLDFKNKVSTDNADTMSAVVKLAEEIDESAPRVR